MNKLLVALVLSVPVATLPAHADDVSDVRERAQYWVDNIGKGDPDAMVALYHPEAILHGTTSPVLRQGHTRIREYFAGITPDLQLTMAFQEPMHIRVHGDTAVNTGFYSTRIGDNDPIPLRYSFVYLKSGDEWLIIDHHSSRLPGQE